MIDSYDPIPLPPPPPKGPGSFLLNGCYIEAHPGYIVIRAEKVAITNCVLVNHGGGTAIGVSYEDDPIEEGIIRILTPRIQRSRWQRFKKWLTTDA